jgi:hypothetical protein
MPSKGVTVYSYISVDGYEVEFTVPKESVTNTPADNFTSKNLEIEPKTSQAWKTSSAVLSGRSGTTER